MRGLESCHAAVESLALLLAKGASQEFVFAHMTCMAWQSRGNYKCLCWSMSCKDLNPAHAKLQLQSSEMCVQASASKAVPETSFQGKRKPILLVFQQELLWECFGCTVVMVCSDLVGRRNSSAPSMDGGRGFSLGLGLASTAFIIVFLPFCACRARHISG